MIYDSALYSDVIITWLGAAGIWGYLNFVHHHRAGGTLERNTMFLLYCVLALMVVRGFYWLLDYPWLGYFRFLPTALIPLAVVLFGESLMRRHVNFPMKVYSAGGTIFFLVIGILDQLQNSKPLLLGLLTFEVSTIILIAWMVWRTDRGRLNAGEIRLNNAVCVAAMFAAPLIITDFREELTWIPRRLGAAGALIFVYVLVRMTYRADTRTIVFRELLTIFLRASIMALSFMAITDNLNARKFFEFFPLSLMFMLVFTIFYRLKAASVESRGVSFLQWLLRAKMTSLEAFVNSLRHLPLTQENVLLRLDDLRRYDGKAITQFLGSQRRILNLTALRAQITGAGPARTEIAEQLAGILERYGMNHIGLVSQDPPTLLLFNSPLIPGANLDEIKINLVLKVSRLLSASVPQRVAGSGPGTPPLGGSR